MVKPSKSFNLWKRNTITLEPSGENKVNEPAFEYSLEAETEILPALTEDDVKETITRDELLEYIFEMIDKLPGK